MVSVGKYGLTNLVAASSGKASFGIANSMDLAGRSMFIIMLILIITLERGNMVDGMVMVVKLIVKEPSMMVFTNLQFLKISLRLGKRLSFMIQTLILLLNL